MLLNITLEFVFAWGFVLSDKTIFQHGTFLWILNCLICFITNGMLVLLLGFIIEQLFIHCLLLVWNTCDDYKMYEPVIIWRLTKLILSIVAAIIVLIMNNLWGLVPDHITFYDITRYILVYIINNNDIYICYLYNDLFIYIIILY